MTIGIVCSDAGAAEIISSYVLKYNLKCVFNLHGPAISIFSKKLEYKIDSVDCKTLVEKSSWLLLGTSSYNMHEHNAIIKAKIAGKYCISYIDHWSGYSRRFLRGNDLIYPNEIWVTDIYAYKRAIQEFYDIKIRIQKNLYLDHITSSSNTKCKLSDDNITILYLGEPISESAQMLHGDKMFWGYDEHDSIRYFFKNYPGDLSKIKRVIIRPHPKENPDKYNWVGAYFDFAVDRSENSNLVHDIELADIVVGCSSMAMIVALNMKKPVYSSIPIKSNYPKLPHKDIIYI
jgi:hypothetical protein